MSFALADFTNVDDGAAQAKVADKSRLFLSEHHFVPRRLIAWRRPSLVLRSGEAKSKADRLSDTAEHIDGKNIDMLCWDDIILFWT